MKFEITRAWKDEAYRQSLSLEERNMLPANPAGEVELAESDLASVYGGGFGPGGFGLEGFGYGGFGKGPVTVIPIQSTHVISLAVTVCNLQTYSINAIPQTVVFLSPVRTACINVN